MALTEAQKEQKLIELGKFIDEHKDEKGPLMPIMQKAQELLGYLSMETQIFIAESLDITGLSRTGMTVRYRSLSSAKYTI